MSRKGDVAGRLRKQLRQKRESLADQFEFRMYIAFVPKDPHKSVLFQAAEVLPVMTNNYEESILRGAQEENYSLESSLELLQKDVVQLHAQRYFSLRNDVVGDVSPMSFFLWPRTDVKKVVCLLFSRWKDDTEAPFKLLNADFEFLFEDYERQLYRFMLTRKEKKGIIINNPCQSMFVFIDRGFMNQADNKTIFFKLTSICLYLPQDQLTNWGPGTIDEILEMYQPLPLSSLEPPVPLSREEEERERTKGGNLRTMLNQRLRLGSRSSESTSSSSTSTSSTSSTSASNTVTPTPNVETSKDENNTASSITEIETDTPTI